MHFKQTSKDDEFVKYMTRESIIRATNRAKRMNLNRIADMRFVKSLHPDVNFPVMFQMDHPGYNGKPDVMRYVIMTNRSEHDMLQIDIPHKFVSKDVFKMRLNNREDRNGTV
tara:strand:- start:1456 stop:1791 length:336 start_codon:yes stop_codon:yes gene_type:complete